MEDEDIRALVRILRRIMADEYVTMQGMARRLGFATSHVSMILAGKRRPGLRFVWAAMEHIPEVRELMLSRHAGKRKPPGSTPGG
ncbi:MAG: hypothetical protein GXX94_06220 [Chloroflexi bacterium]|nr:hypothetical protein [Chloroflexota bacterium]